MVISHPNSDFLYRDQVLVHNPWIASVCVCVRVHVCACVSGVCVCVCVCVFPLNSPGGVPFTIRKHSQRPEEVSSVIINKNEKIKPFPNTETGKRGLSCSSRFKWKAMFQKHNRSKQLRKDKTKLCVGGKTVAVITRWIGSQCTGSKVEERPLLAREYRSLPPKCSIYWGSSQLDAHYCG